MPDCAICKGDQHSLLSTVESAVSRLYCSIADAEYQER